jgi:hypothetical protein
VKHLVILVAALMLVVAACGDSNDDGSATPDNGAGAAAEATGTPQVVQPTQTPTAPSATPTATEPEREQRVEQVIGDDAPGSPTAGTPTLEPTATPTARDSTPTASPTSTPTVAAEEASLPELPPLPPLPELMSCEHAADLAIERVQIWLDAMGVLPEGADLEETPMPQAFADFMKEFDAQMSAIESGAYALGCTDDQMQALILERLDQLEANNPTAAIILAEIVQGIAPEEGDPRPTATPDPTAVPQPTATPRPIVLDWDIQTCEEVADFFIDRVQQLLYDLDDMELADLTGEEPPEPIESFEQDMERLSTISDELACGSDELNRLVAERLDQLVARGVVSQLLLEAITEAVADGEIFPLE